MSKRKICLCLIFFMMLVACVPSIDQDTAPEPSLATNTPTPEATPLILAANTKEPDKPPITGGVIEIRIPYEIEGGVTIAEPGEGNECVYELPFKIAAEGERKMAHGSLDIVCHWTIPTGPLPYTVHVIEEAETSFDGEIFPASESFPEGWIDGYLNVDGTVTLYYEDVPPDIPNLCPETSPCTAPGTVVFNLPFPWKEGSKIEEKWIFILHLGEN